MSRHQEAKIELWDYYNVMMTLQSADKIKKNGKVTLAS